MPDACTPQVPPSAAASPQWETMGGCASRHVDVQVEALEGQLVAARAAARHAKRQAAGEHGLGVPKGIARPVVEAANPVQHKPWPRSQPAVASLLATVALCLLFVCRPGRGRAASQAARVQGSFPRAGAPATGWPGDAGRSCWEECWAWRCLLDLHSMSSQ